MIKTRSAKDLFDLFKILGYPESVILDPSSKRKKSDFDFRKEDEERIKEIFSILSFDKNLPVFLLETTTLHPSFVRSVASTFDKQYLQFLLIFTTDYSEISFVFPDKEKIEAGKHKLKLTKLTLDKEDIKSKRDYYSVIQTLANMEYEDKASWREVWRKWKKAFSVERVTEEFFERYKEVFFKLRDELHKQRIPSKESHEFTLQFLNRIMFIYFISKKNWLEKSKFVDWLWYSYKELGKFNSNEFYEEWLKQVFLKAFNNRSNEIKGLPDEVVKVISNVPYLNGGLFRENDLDNLKVQISDRMFQKILEFFESYNFTIREDMPLESEVAVDPQMIGYVYESLANVAEEIYDRNDLGIFYTPRVEVDFMCRRSLVEHLSKNLSDLPKEKFYHLIFDPAEESEKVEGWFTKNEHWRRLEDALNNLSVVDPACGSGAFLVGMLNVVSDVYRMIYKHIGNSLSDFALKNRVIQYSLYGVDVMPWAIHAAELRLWLQLIVETEFKKEELRQHPLLPNLNLNLRVGDSLVQEIGGISFNLRTNNLKPHLKRKLEELKQEKRKYFENSPTAKFKTPEEVKEEEIRLFEEIIDERIESLEADIQVFEKKIKSAKSQITLAGEHITDEKRIKENEEKIEINNKEIDKLKSVKQHLKDPEKKPFVWDIDFAEIFSDKKGFDIVFGNPPYVRQEMITPPNKLKSEVTTEEKKKYKDKLIESVKERFPVVKDLGKRSDYYIYFYFHGLSLLNINGTFCFITSNSWLDVEYGKGLQEFLCKYVPITAIYDNPKRSFTHADVNTIIALFGAPEAKQRSLGDWLSGMNGGNERIWPRIKNIAKFVMFKKPFEEVLSSQNLVNIENIKVKVKGEGITELVKNVVSTNDYRVFPIVQEDLLGDGWEYPENYKGDRFKTGSYEGNKWGGKFLRAPDIFLLKVLSRYNSYKSNKLAVNTYLNTGGADDFFFVKMSMGPDDFCVVQSQNDKKYPEKFEVESKYVSKLIRSPSLYSKTTISPSDVHHFFINIPPKENINGKKIESYIKYGEENKFNKRSCKLRSEPWYVLQEQARRSYEILVSRHHNNTFNVFYNPEKIIFNSFYGLATKGDPLGLIIELKSTLGNLQAELFGRTNQGEGVLNTYGWDIEFYRYIGVKVNETRHPKIIELFHKWENRSIFCELGIDPNKPIREQELSPLPDRAELDNIIFDQLGLTQEERKEFYWSVCELVKQRLDKAKSLKGKK
ncbi:Eco57I restriction-modification methylase domain-containing protein [Cuniculiplasma divulgatum]|uniref:Eco57I restriction-modification methylase domain-containing protein n=1 Tax=Cuniculiplasma divulgatum TaxID=1673428 RepID=UPI00097D1D85|nr:DNA methyltransferase [Cuniculiplasma divulgatum]